MVKLDLGRVNSVSPYLVQETKEGKIYRFTTDYGVDYGISFDLDYLITSGDSYQFYIININNRRSPRDPKVRDTVIACVREFFMQSNAAMLYICETGDKKQRSRSRLFHSWLRKAEIDSEFCGMLYYCSAAVEDAEGIENFVTLIMRRDNPNLAAIVQEFSDTILVFQQKPE